jgi:hypothetical protein
MSGTMTKKSRKHYETCPCEFGKFGVHETYNLLQGQYWWRSMQLEAQNFVS